VLRTVINFPALSHASLGSDPSVALSFSIDPYRRLLLTVVDGPLCGDEADDYTSALLAHPDRDYVERHLVDARRMHGAAEELATLLTAHRALPPRSRLGARRAILAAGGPRANGAGPALGRALVIHRERSSGVTLAYRVFRDPAAAERFLHIGRGGRPAPRV
jgi:hypothetical protein